jgi:O-antigen/teichoic acid export membrane protein
MYSLLKKSKIFKSLLQLFSSNILVNTIRFIYITLLIKFYSIEEYGLFVLILGYLSIVTLIAGLGFENIIISKMVNNNKNNSLFYAYMIFFSFFLSLSCIILDYLNHSIDIYVILPFIIFTILSKFNTTALYAKGEHAIISKMIVVQGFFSYILLIFLVLVFKLSIVELVSIEFILKLVFLSLFIVFYSRNIFLLYLYNFQLNLKNSFLFLRFIKKDGQWLIYNLIVNKFLNQFLTIIFGEFISLSFLGIWDAINKVLAIFQIAISYLEQVIVSTKTKANIIKTKEANMKKIFLVSFLFTIVAIFISNIYVYYLVNNYSLNELLLATLLSLTLFTYGYRTFMRALFTIKEWTKEIFKLNVISNIVQVGGVYLLVLLNIATEVNVAILYLIVSILGYVLYAYYYKLKNKGNL